MEGLIIGIDLCDSYTQVCCEGQEAVWEYPTVICKKRDSDDWYVGEEAYGCALEGSGVIVDKLLKLVKKDGTATIAGIRYRGQDFLKKFLEKILEVPKEVVWTEDVAQVVITLPKVEAGLMDALMFCADYLKIPRERFHIISHTEAFIYYVLSQKREVWNNHVGMFDLAEAGLWYYELKVQRGLRQVTVVAEKEKLEEGFNLDILNTASGLRLADKILCSCGERLLQKKLFSSIFLTGKGFGKQDWAEDFMKLICTRRKVYGEPAIFSKGAVYKAVDYTREKTSYPFVLVCDGRLNTTVSMKVTHKDQESQLVLAAAGDNWYEAGSTMDFILDNQNFIEFTILPMNPKERKTVKMTLENFPERPDKTMRIQVSVSFLDENTMEVLVRDKGFGELFPSTDAVIRQEVML